MLVRLALSQIETFQSTSCTSSPALAFPSGMSRQNLKWQPPKALFIKTNWDAAIASLSIYFGLGGIVRNLDGDILAAFCSNLLGPLKPKIAEAMALSCSPKLC